MPLLDLLPPLLLAALAIWIGRGTLQRSRSRRARDGRPQPLLEIVALVVLGLVVVIAVAVVVAAWCWGGYAAGLGCALLPAQIGLITLASGMLVLARAQAPGPPREYGDGCVVFMLWLITFGIGVCYAQLLGHRGMFH